MPKGRILISVASPASSPQDSIAHSEYEIGAVEQARKVVIPILNILERLVHQYAVAEGVIIRKTVAYRVLRDAPELVLFAEYENEHPPLLECGPSADHVLNRAITDTGHVIDEYNKAARAGNTIVLAECDHLPHQATEAAQKLIATIALSKFNEVKMVINGNTVVWPIFDIAATDFGETVQDTAHGVPDNTRRLDSSFILRGASKLPRIRAHEEMMHTVFWAQKNGTPVFVTYCATKCYQHGTRKLVDYWAVKISPE